MRNSPSQFAILFSAIVLCLPLPAEAQPFWQPVTDAITKDNYQTNKFDLKAGVEAGGWHTAWSEDITETDAAKGLVAVGVSIYAKDPTPFIDWVKALVDRTVESLKKSSKDIPADLLPEMRGLARRIIRDAVAEKSEKVIERDLSGIQFKAGAIRYSGANKLGNQTWSRTWGLKPYVAVRVVSEPLLLGQDTTKVDIKRYSALNAADLLDKTKKPYLHNEPDTNNEFHLWSFEPVNGYWLITSRKTNHALNAGEKNGDNVFLHEKPSKHNDFHLWLLHKVGDKYMLISKKHPFAMDANNAAGQIYMNDKPDEGNENQLFSIIGSGEYHLILSTKKSKPH